MTLTDLFFFVIIAGGVICAGVGFMDAAVMAKVDVGASLVDKIGRTSEDRWRDVQAIWTELSDRSKPGPRRLVIIGLGVAGLALAAMMVFAPPGAL